MCVCIHFWGASFHFGRKAFGFSDQWSRLATVMVAKTFRIDKFHKRWHQTIGLCVSLFMIKQLLFSLFLTSIFFLISPPPPPPNSPSPWCNCTGWLGVKHQLTYLPPPPPPRPPPSPCSCEFLLILFFMCFLHMLTKTFTYMPCYSQQHWFLLFLLFILFACCPSLFISFNFFSWVLVE